MFCTDGAYVGSLKLVVERIVEQAGAELCQAQGKLRLVGFWLDL